MPSERLPWVTVRRNADGSLRYYWQRKGHKLVTLPKDPIERLQRVTELNAAADATAEALAPHGTIAWCVGQYRASTEFEKLAKGTKKVYRRWLGEFERKIGKRHAAAFTRGAVMELKARLLEKHKLGTVNHAFAVLRIILEIARDRDVIEVNPAAKPRLSTAEARDTIWQDDDFLRVTQLAGAEVRVALFLLLYTAQRPGDVVRMAWSQYDPAQGRILVRQEKTGKRMRELLGIPVHRALRAALEGAARRGPLVTVHPNGRSWTAARLRLHIQAVMELAEVDPRVYQVRDLRRTAVVKLAEAGASVPQIAAVTGHGMKQVEKILAVYLPRRSDVAAAGIEAWERVRPPGTKR